MHYGSLMKNAKLIKNSLLAISLNTLTLGLPCLVQAEATTSAQDSYIHESHTVESLASLNDQQLFELIRAKAITEKCTPKGTSAGKPGRMDEKAIKKSNLTKTIFKGLFQVLGPQNSKYVAGMLWHGKVFEQNPGCTTGTGTNRINLGITESRNITFTHRVLSVDDFIKDKGRKGTDVNEQAFVSALQAVKEGTNLVELNYSKPKDDPLHAGKNFGVRDIMVPIKGKNGTIYVGRAYGGEWISETQFRSTGLVAWFFLDFSPTAVSAQGH